MTEQPEQNEETTEEQPDVESIKADYESQISELQKELLTHKNKEYNFRKMRDMSEAEVEALTEREKELLTRQEKLEEDQQSFSTRITEGHKSDAFAVFAGDDKDLLDKVQFHYDNTLSGVEATTKDETNAKAKQAYLLATGGQAAGVDSLSRAVAYHGGRGTPKTDSHDLTADQLDLAKRFGLKEDDFKKDKK